MFTSFAHQIWNVFVSGFDFRQKHYFSGAVVNQGFSDVRTSRIGGASVIGHCRILDLVLETNDPWGAANEFGFAFVEQFLDVAVPSRGCEWCAVGVLNEDEFIFGYVG